MKCWDRDIQVDWVLPADMAAHVCLLGHGGIRDSDEHFCMHCKCLKSDRHRPLCLFQVQAEAATVEDLAAAHCMPTDLFLAMNTGWGPSGMSPEVELTERVL